MPYRLTDSQEKIILLVETALNQKPTPQLKFFWRKLRIAALPKCPPRKKNQGVVEAALTQTRWQRLAALAADSHVAASALLKQEIELERELTASQGASENLTSDEASQQLCSIVADAPISIQGEVFRILASQHPDWLEPGAWD